MKRMIGIFVCMLILTNCFPTPVTDDRIVLADTPPSDVEIDYDYIRNVTENLSNIIYTSYLENELAKGRAFGTKGEWAAAFWLAEEMKINLSLYDPTVEFYDDFPYFEKIYPTKYRLYGFVNGQPLTRKIEILSKHAAINYSINNTESLDCFIMAVSNGTFTMSKKKYSDYDMSLLNHNFSYNGTKIVNKSKLIDYNSFNIWEFLNKTIDKILDYLSSLQNNSELSIVDILEPLIEDEYNFSYDNIDPEDNSTWPEFINKNISNIDLSEPFVTISECKAFNPKFYNYWDAYIGLKVGAYTITGLVKEGLEGFIRYVIGPKTLEKIFPDSLIGYIEYDYSDESHDTNILVDSNLPVILINGSDGRKILDHGEYEENFTIKNITFDFYIKQANNESVTSYNVIGQINGRDTNKTILVSSLYDSLWCQGSSDSAVSVGIVLALAKYMKYLEQNDIKPRYNVKFVLFSGEEYGVRGAYHYEKVHRKENITAVIDFNQLGMKQPDPQNDPPLTLHLITSRLRFPYILGTIEEQSNYDSRSEYNCESEYSLFGTLSNDEIFAFRKVFDGDLIKTVCFIKDRGWYLHHRDGMNHTEGDSLKYIDWHEVNITAELGWNVTKFFAYDPSVWFETTPSITPVDTTDDGIDNYDCVNISYEIDTSWPSERVTVRAVLYPKYKYLHPFFNKIYRLRMEKEYMLTPDGTEDFINISLPDYYPKGEYNAEIFLINSRNDTILDSIHLLGLEVGIDGLEFLNYLINSANLKLLRALSPFEGEIYESLGIRNIENWIKGLSNFRSKRVRDFLIDLCAKNLSSDSHKSTFEMHPPNLPPNTPEKPQCLGPDENEVFYSYKTRTTDPDQGDLIRYQWEWNGIQGFPTIRKYYPNVYHVKRHKW